MDFSATGFSPQFSIAFCEGVVVSGEKNQKCKGIQRSHASFSP